jgi:hypothetical protein
VIVLAAISSFSESVEDIERLTAYTPRVLPKWFRSQAKGILLYDSEELSDERLVSLNFQQLKLNDWGTAIIDGSEVFILETESSEGLQEHYLFAEFLRRTFYVVEADAGRGGATRLTTQRVFDAVDRRRLKGAAMI